MTIQTISPAFLILIIAFLVGCQPKNSSEEAASQPPVTTSDSSQMIIKQALEFQGKSHLDTSTIQFRFRQFSMKAIRSGERFQYERAFIDTTSGDSIRDILTNNGLTRLINGRAVDLPNERRQAYGNSVNSVVYFALLPYNLGDPAVQTDYLGTVRIGAHAYHKVYVTFQAEGGGDDFEDQFVYWFRTDTYQLDYLAYNYATDGGGARFRVAKNGRRIGGIYFQDYDNLKPIDSEEQAVKTFDQLYEREQLELLSEIATEGIEVQSVAF